MLDARKALADEKRSHDMQGAKRLWRRLGIAAAVIAGIGVSAGYGYLVRRDHLFPYHLVKGIQHKFEPAPVSMRWQKARPDPGAPLASPETVHQLANIPYLQGYRPATAGGAIRAYDRKATLDGLNLFTSGHAPVAFLMDMDGKVVKTWTADAKTSFPGVVLGKEEHDKFLRRAHVFPDGSILALFDEIGLVHLDSSSRVIWAWPARVHHDLAVAEDGRIWILFREKRPVEGIRHREPVWEDFLVELTADGKFVRRLSLVEAFRNSPYAPLLSSVPPGPDIFHTNSVQILDGTLSDRLAGFRKGNLLVSVKNLNTIAVVDPAAGAVTWAVSGQWYAQHCARLLPNGHLMLFDNLGTMKAASRVLEVEPLSQQIVWHFGGRKGEDLLSETSGYVQRLANGNTLVTESNFGRVVEVTPDDRVVWEFVNPNRTGAKNELVGTVYFMERVGRDLPFLAGSQASNSASGGSAPSR
jgi:arylsulfotransferase ASST